MHEVPRPNLESLMRYPVVWFVMLISAVPLFTLLLTDISSLACWFMPSDVEELWTIRGIWRLWTPTFVHYTPLHFFTNICLWWIFATQIESRSRLELIVLLLVGCAVSNSCQYLYAGPNFGGLSGLDYALLGYVGGEYYFAKKSQFQLDSTLAVLMLIMLPLAATGIFGKYADFAHYSGLACGIMLIFLRLLMTDQLALKNNRLFKNNFSND